MTMQEPSHSEKRKQATQARRRQLLEAAVEAFLEQGFHQTGIRDIAKRAGVSLGNLYNHFPSKEAVLIEIANAEAVEIKAFCDRLTGAAAPSMRLRSFFVRFARYAAQEENALLDVEISSEALRSAAVGDVFSANQRMLVDALDQCFADAAAEGVIRPLRDRRRNAQIIIDILTAHGRCCALRRQDSTRSDVRALWALLVDGVSSRQF